MVGPHGDWTSSTTTKPVVQNQVSPRHPSGGYNPNRNQIPPQTNQQVKTGITQTTVDPYDEKGDYMDWDYVNPNTGKTAGQLQAELELSAKTAENEKKLKMQEALAIQSQYGTSLYPGQTDGKENAPWTDKDLLRAQELGLFEHEAAGMETTRREAETNKLKGSLVNKLKRLETQASEGAWGTNSDHINKMIMKNLMESDEWGAVGKLFGSDIMGAVNTFGVKGAIDMGIIDPNDPATKNYFSQTAEGSDVGYDPTGTKTWENIESDPYLYDAYLKLSGGDLTADELRHYLPAAGYKGKPTPQGSGYYNRRPTLIDQRKERQRQLFYGPKVSPIKDLEQAGFFNTMGSKIRNPFLEAVGETLAFNPGKKSGLYGKTYVSPKRIGEFQRGIKPWGLEQHYATGKRSPLHKNVARGGIMSVWNDMRR